MTFSTDLYIGALIGIIVSFKTLLYDLPNRKLAFAFNAFILHKMVGGFHNTSWEKFYVALVTYLLVEQFEAIINAVWDTVLPAATEQFNSLTGATPAPAESVPPPAAVSAEADGNLVGTFLHRLWHRVYGPPPRRQRWF